MAISGQFLTSIQTTLMATYFERKLFEASQRELQMYQFAQKRSIPRSSGKVVWFNRPVRLSAQTTALTESLTPAQVQLSSEGVSATVKIYGAFTARSELVSMTAIDIDWMAGEFGYNAGLTIDSLIRDEFLASASGYGTAATTSAGSVLTGAKVRNAVFRLRSNDVPGLVGNNLYPLIIHPNQSYDLGSDTSAGGWQNPVVQATVPSVAEDLLTRSAIRDIYGARVYESTNVLASADGSAGLAVAGSTSSFVYRAMMFGKDAYGCVQIQGPGGGNLSNPQVIVKDLGSGGTEDPLNQRATIGWKAIFTPIFFRTTSDPVRGVVLFTGATGL